MLMWIGGTAHTLYRAFASERSTTLAKIVILVIAGVMAVAASIEGARYLLPSYDSTPGSSGFHRGPAR